MKVKEVTYQTGNTIKYKIINGTAYHINTDDEVVRILENARITNKKIRIFYGDTETGRCWNEEFDIIGKIGRSGGGEIHIPILVKNVNSTGGGAILDHCIVRITVDKVDVYRHKGFSVGEMYVKENDEEYDVYIDNKMYARFKSMSRAERFIKFLNGERNSK